MTDEQQQGMTRERATDLVDLMSRTELIEFVQSHYSTMDSLRTQSNDWANACQTARAERDSLLAQVEGLESMGTDLHSRIERLVDEREAFGRRVWDAIPESVRELILDEARDSMRRELVDELRDELRDELESELREELEQEYGDELREALNRLDWF